MVSEEHRNFVLAADIGGTHTTIAVYSVGEVPNLIIKENYSSYKIDEFYHCINEVLKKAYEAYGICISDACIGMAGPTEPDRSFGRLTNLPWSVDVRHILKNTMLKRILLLNDIESIGLGIPILMKTEPKRIIQLRNGDGRMHEAVKESRMCIVAPGTGLGTCILNYGREKGGYVSIPSEAGQVDFPPSNDLEWALFRYLKDNVCGGVSPGFERVLSGQGISNIYRFLRSIGKEESELLRMIDSLDDREKPKSIQENMQNSILCHECMDIFLSVFARRAKNLALTSVAYGGVYLAGGISLKMIHLLENPRFMEIFETNDKLSHILKRIPVYVVMDYGINMLGCADAAIRMIDEAWDEEKSHI